MPKDAVFFNRMKNGSGAQIHNKRVGIKIVNLNHSCLLSEQQTLPAQDFTNLAAKHSEFP
jgi:hypothetical protein